MCCYFFLLHEALRRNDVTVFFDVWLKSLHKHLAGGVCAMLSVAVNEDPHEDQQL